MHNSTPHSLGNRIPGSAPAPNEHDWVRPQLKDLGSQVGVQMREFDEAAERLYGKLADIVGIHLGN